MSAVSVELQPGDDIASIRRRLQVLEAERVALILPWEMRFLSRPLDFDLLRREAERRRMQVAIISRDPERRLLARACGFPTFANVAEAQAAGSWRMWPSVQVEPPPRHWWDEPVVLSPRPRPLAPSWVARAGLGARLAIFFLALTIVAATAYLVVPSAHVTLTPMSQTYTIVVPVAVDAEAEEVDVAARTIPARRIGDEFEGYLEVETTGLMSVFAGRATGAVLFTNLLAQDYTVPAGTVVRTSSTSYPVRFRTTESVVVPAGGQALAPIETLEQRGGNVAAFQINQVEGVAASAVRVINPEPTRGADLQEVRVVTSEDYERARTLLMRQLLDQAAIAFQEEGYLQPTEMLLRQSLRVEAVPKQAYNRFVTEQADMVGLTMRVLVSGWVIDMDNAEAVAYAALAGRVPEGHRLLGARFEVGEVAEEDITPGDYTLFVTATGYADVTLDVGAAARLIRGMRADEARERLMTSFPLAEEPQVTLWPEWPAGFKWLERVPLIPLRIQVQVQSSVQDMSQAGR